MMRSTFIRLSLLAAVVLLVAPSLAGASGVITAVASPALHALCNGTTTSKGIIAASPIIGSGTQGVASVVTLATIIMLSIVLVMAVLYMVSQLARLPTLATFVKVELAEMVATAVIIAIFFGGFYASAFSGIGLGGIQAQSLTNSGSSHFNGPGRAVFVNDCTTLGAASLELIPPIITSGVINYGINLVTSLNFKITPGGFGFSVSPLGGVGLITTTLNELQGILATFIIAITAVIFMLSLVYSLFPIFLYIGIVMRAFPWTRAAGGIFIAMFIGFYVVFPLMLLATTNGFATATYQETVSYLNSSSSTGAANFMNASSATNIGTVVVNASGSSSTGGFTSFFGTLLGSAVGFPNNYGVINGFISDFIGPPVITIIEIAFAFIVALDFADILSDILGAPSLTTEGLLGKVL
jgi:hypothetical protein